MKYDLAGSSALVLTPMCDIKDYMQLMKSKILRQFFTLTTTGSRLNWDSYC